MNREEFYLNKLKNHSCIKLPSKDADYLKIDNYLSEFTMEDEKAEARSNLGITPLLEELKALIDAKVIESGSISWDLEPIEGNIGHVLSSDALYNLLLKYYNKDEIDRLILELYNRFVAESKITVDEEILDSTNPVLNLAIKYALDALYLSLLENVEDLKELINSDKQSFNDVLSTKVDSETLENYYTKTLELVKIDEINSKIDQLREDIPGMIGNVVYEPIDNEYIENLIRNAYAE